MAPKLANPSTRLKVKHQFAVEHAGLTKTGHYAGDEGITKAFTK